MTRTTADITTTPMSATPAGATRTEYAARQPTAARSGTWRIGGELPVHRLGFGSMQLPGPGVWGRPQNVDAAITVLRRAVDLGVNLIDTADSYGPYDAEDLIREALHPYPDGLVITTKGGLLRSGAVAYNEPWPSLGRPEYLRQCVEMSLRRLRLDTIDLYQLHRIDPQVPVEDSLGELSRMREEGKIRHIGVSEVDLATLKQCRAITEIATVENRYNIQDRAHENVLAYCEQSGLAFITWDPLASGALITPDGPLADAAAQHGCTPAQIAIAWLLAKSPSILAIPGTTSAAHLEENVAAAMISLTSAELTTITIP